MTPKKGRGVGTYLLIAVLLIAALIFLLPNLNRNTDSYTYSEIISYFDEKEVASYTLDLGSGELEMTLDSGERITYEVPYVAQFLDDTENYRKQYNQTHDEPVEYDYYEVRDSSWLLTIIPTVILVVIDDFPVRFHDASGKRRRKVYLVRQGKY